MITLKISGLEKIADGRSAYSFRNTPTQGEVDVDGISQVKFIPSPEDIAEEIASNNIYSANEAGITQVHVDKYLEQMRTGTFTEIRGVGGFEYNGKYIVGEGNHKLYAAFQYILEEGDPKYVNQLMSPANARWTLGNPQSYGRPTLPLKLTSKSWWKFW